MCCIGFGEEGNTFWHNTGQFSATVALINTPLDKHINVDSFKVIGFPRQERHIKAILS